ncbi:DUF1657 domain-containing protein [Metabacillus sp. RGM 3146]|uniref:DUF1657 domain-containing protein n=1 Tax=Metabacillus sp. RGM 3146 TaxID=3401092 RepID=UPI003B9AB188
MTISSEVKQCLANLKSAQASLSDFALKTGNKDSKKVFHECMMHMDPIISDLKERVGELEREEPQYKGF